MLSEMSYLLEAPVVGTVATIARGGFGGGGFGFFVGGLVTAVWAAIIVLAVLWVVRNWSSPKNPITGMIQRATTGTAGSTQAPLEVVQMRYAKGEINREEYESLRRDLTVEATSAQEPSEPTPPSPTLSSPV